MTGTLTQTPPPAAEPDEADAVALRPFSREEYYRLAELGFFAGQKVERLGGLLYMVMSPQKFGHYATLDGVADLFRGLFGAGHWVRSQAPLELGQATDPEPDVSVVRGSRAMYTGHPTTAVLVVEVSDATLRTDRGAKASLYAAAGIPDYWVLDPRRRRLEVCRDPQPDAPQPAGWGYADRRWLTAADFISPIALPAAAVPVASLLS
jgi:Uma2 family endonuclease